MPASVGSERPTRSTAGARWPSSRPTAPSSARWASWCHWLDGAPSGEAMRDARAVLHAIRHRLAYSAVFSMASPTWLSLELVEPAATATPGPDARGEATLAVHSNAPAGATVRILRNGVPHRETSSADWSMPLPAGESAAMYRAEMWLPARRGWPALPVAVSASRGHNLADTTPPGTGSRVTGHGYRAREPGLGPEGTWTSRCGGGTWSMIRRRAGSCCRRLRARSRRRRWGSRRGAASASSRPWWPTWHRHPPTPRRSAGTVVVGTDARVCSGARTAAG